MSVASGPNSGGVFADDAGVGAIAWVNVSNAASSNNIYATYNPSGAEQSHYLKATSFGFALPAGATIVGIVVEIECKASTGSEAILSAFMVKAGTILSSYGLATPTLTPTESYRTLGSATEMWGTTWTEAQVEATNFGVAIYETGAIAPTTTSVDHIRLTVYYTPAPTVTNCSPATGGAGGGTAVTLTGTDFQVGSTVSIGGVAATSVVRVSSTSITCVTGAHSAGVVNVVVTNPDAIGTGTLTNGFTYVSPTVTSISPTHGPLSTAQSVSLVGTRFTGTTGVTIGGQACTSVSVVDDTHITCVSPLIASVGNKAVVVTTPEGTGTLA